MATESTAVEKCKNGRKKGGRKRKKIVANLESDDNDDMEVEELATGDDILNSSANDFVDASKEATKVGTDVPNDDAGHRRKSTRIRRNLIIEAENQAKLEQKSREIELEQKTKNKRHSEHFFSQILMIFEIN